MVVDTKTIFAISYKRVLTNEGFDVESFLDGGSAIESIRVKNYDVVITDLKMPKIDGFYVIKKVAKCRRKLT